MQKYRTLLVLAVATLGGLFFVFKGSPQLAFNQVGIPTQKQTPKKTKKANFIQGDVLVKFKKDTPERIKLYYKQKLKIKTEDYIKSIQVYHWRGNFDTTSAIDLLMKSKHVKYAEPNYTVSTQKTP